MYAVLASCFMTDDLTRYGLGGDMHNLAVSYTALGRHQDALPLRQKTLEIRRRVFPENHPTIGVMCSVCSCQSDFTRSVLPVDAMSGLAVTYMKLRRFQDALVLQEKTLEIRRRVLPEDHPIIGVWCSMSFPISLSIVTFCSR